MIFPAAQDGVEKIYRGVLFKLDAVTNAVGSVEQQADAQWNVRLAAEVLDGLRSVLVKNLEIVLREIRNEFVATVQDGRKNVDQVDDGNECGLAFLCLLLIRRRRLRLLLLRAFRDG